MGDAVKKTSLKSESMVWGAVALGGEKEKCLEAGASLGNWASGMW